MENNCEHSFVHGGIKYRVEEWKMLRSNAYEVTYYDWYYCMSCLEQSYVKLWGTTNTGQKILYNATPVDRRNHDKL